MQTAPGASAASRAAQKLDEFFRGLTEEEQQVVSEMVRASLLQAAERFAGAQVADVPGAIEAFDIPAFVTGLTGANAPARSGRDADFIARPPHRSVRAAFPHTAHSAGEG